MNKKLIVFVLFIVISSFLVSCGKITATPTVVPTRYKAELPAGYCDKRDLTCTCPYGWVGGSLCREAPLAQIQVLNQGPALTATPTPACSGDPNQYPYCGAGCTWVQDYTKFPFGDGWGVVCPKPMANGTFDFWQIAKIKCEADKGCMNLVGPTENGYVTDLAGSPPYSVVGYTYVGKEDFGESGVTIYEYISDPNWNK